MLVRRGSRQELAGWPLNHSGPLLLLMRSAIAGQGPSQDLCITQGPPKMFSYCCKRAPFKRGALTSIAGLVHVSDLKLTTQILIFLCQTCSVYATKQFGYPSKILHHLLINLWVFKVISLIHTIWPPSGVIGLLSIDSDCGCNIHIISRDPMEICDECTWVWEISFTRWRFREHLQKACNFTKMWIVA